MEWSSAIGKISREWLCFGMVGREFPNLEVLFAKFNLVRNVLHLTEKVLSAFSVGCLSSLQLFR